MHFYMYVLPADRFDSKCLISSDIVWLIQLALCAYNGVCMYVRISHGESYITVTYTVSLLNCMVYIVNVMYRIVCI